ncbi:cagE, TrbE, VirB, component of type IV transporter system family protein (plasmid) [Yersinia frederiksenii Y225]|nr:cagE, TrbE, VirB, component of type IV transporter system family protein [Yersinia frederiksenii Y225]
MKIRSKNAKDFIPDYAFHINNNSIYLKDGKLMATLVLKGFPFESVSDDEVYNRFSYVKDFLVSTGKQGNLYLWTNIIKCKVKLNQEYRFGNNIFLQEFSDKYIGMFQKNDFYSTDYFLTVGINYTDIYSGEERLNEIIEQCLVIFKDFGVNVLGTDEQTSELAERYLTYLYNHQNVKIPLSASPIKESINNSEIIFGYDVTEIKNKDVEVNRFCTNYLIKDFPRNTKIGHWDFLLKMPYEFVLTQSFIFESATKSLKKIDQQVNKLNSVGDSAISQQAELELGKEAVQTGVTLFGSYHAALSVFGDTPKEAKDNGRTLSSEFISSGGGFRFIKSTSEAPFTYFSHLPMSKRRPLSTIRTVTNLTCTWSLHNYSGGKATGNPIGDGTAIMPLKTVSDGLYYFNSHYSDPHKNVLGQLIAGHALILGATGAGKTTLEGAAAAFLQRFNTDLFVIDYNRSTELFVRAFGGSYFALQNGVKTGLVPFQIADNDDEDLMSFLKAWVKRCAVNNDGTDCTDKEAIIIDGAVDSIMRMPRSSRRFGQFAQLISSDSDLAIRLSKWWGSGPYAWALDSETNIFNPNDFDKVGFDTTVILDSVGGKDHPACEPLLSVLFFYKDRMQKQGKTMLTIVEEFWKPANFPMTQALIKAVLKAGRMKGEFIWLTSQSPEDAINCEIFAAIVQQTPTKVFLPNPDANWEGYKKVGLNEKEFKQLKSLGLASRTFLIKQSNSSAFAKMDLFGFDDFLPIISGSKAGISLCEIIRREKNTDDPNVWIPEFRKRLPDYIRQHGQD